MTAGPSGARDNGLPAAAFWAPLGECDPRVADEILQALAGAAIAAYASPSGGLHGGYLDVHLPRRPMDRIFVDGAERVRAEALVHDRLHGGDAALDPPSADDTFAAIIAGFHDPAPRGGWSAAEDVDDARPPTIIPPPPVRPSRPSPGLLDPGGLLYDSPIGEGDDGSADPFVGDEHHYQPPVIGRLAPVQRATRLSIVAILAGIALLVAPALGVFTDGNVAEMGGVFLIVGGVATLVYRMRDDPPEDRGDGAQV